MFLNCLKFAVFRQRQTVLLSVLFACSQGIFCCPIMGWQRHTHLGVIILYNKYIVKDKHCYQYFSGSAPNLSVPFKFPPTIWEALCWVCPVPCGLLFTSLSALRSGFRHLHSFYHYHTCDSMMAVLPSSLEMTIWFFSSAATSTLLWTMLLCSCSLPKQRKP